VGGSASCHVRRNPNHSVRACRVPASIPLQCDRSRPANVESSGAGASERALDRREQCTAVITIDCGDERLDARGSALRAGFAGNAMEGGGCCSGDKSAAGDTRATEQPKVHKCAAGDRCTCGDDCKCAPGQPGCDACAAFQAEIKAAKVAKEAAESTTA
jgi:hypothetical protein